jgi:hypothetical protein
MMLGGIQDLWGLIGDYGIFLCIIILRDMFIFLYEEEGGVILLPVWLYLL